MLLFYIRKTKKSSPKLKTVWKQVFPENAESRIQRAFEMLLGDEFTRSSKNQLETTVDNGSPEIYNRVNEKKSKQITHSSRSGRKTTGF